MEFTTEQILHYWQVVKADVLTYSLFSISNQSIVDETIKKLEKLKKLEEGK